MKYIFLDVDGTLYSSSIHAVPSSAKSALEKARKNGHKVYLCTGRNEPSCGKSLKVDVDGYIYSSGSLVKSEGKIIHDAPFTSEEVQYIKDLVKKFNLGYSMECGKGSYCDTLGYAATTHYFTGGSLTEENKQVARDHFFFEDHEGVEDTCYKLGIYATSMKDFKPVFEYIPDTMYLNVLSNEGDPFVIGELTHKNVSKATGIHNVIDYEQGNMEDTIGFGDSSNDLPMLKACHISVAMGNGAKHVKDEADFVTKDIDDDGLEYAFKKLGLID